MLKVLGIESSCDESAVSIVRSDRTILSNVVLSQIEDHTPYAGVVPEIAARKHLNNLEYGVLRALKESGLELKELDGVAATCGPGLIGGLIISTIFGKALSFRLNVPYIAINHLEGHALTARLTNNVPYPYLLLLMSGGHCQFIAITGLGKYKILGNTLDDSVGEAFDKIAKMLGLGYPGGPLVEKMALLGNKHAFKLPLSLIDRPGCDMSFSGLKTAVRRIIERNPLNEQERKDLCASFQHTVAEILNIKLRRAMEEFTKHYNSNNIVIAGGVAANTYIREYLRQNLQEYEIIAPPASLCTDNAAMIAWAGVERLSAGMISPLDMAPRASWSLEEL